MLHGIPLQVSLACPRCHQPVHVQGLGEVQLCNACQSTLSLPAERWVGWFGPEAIAEALTLPEGEGRQVSTLGGSSANYAYGHRMPRCQTCETDVPAAQLPALAASGGWSCPCGQMIRVREANEIAALLVPGARWLVHEGATGADGGAPQGAAEPVLFACMACGGGLRVDGSTRTVACEFCGGSNYLPDGLWLRLNPRQTVQTFFIVAELDEDSASPGVVALPLAFLERLAGSDDSDVRTAVAANPATPPELLSRLAADDDDEVRVAVARSPRTPPALLDRLATDSDSDVRSAVARNPATPPTLFATLARDRDYEVRRDVVRSGRAPADVLVAIATQEDDSDVLSALARVPPTPELLEIFAAKSDATLHLVAARHPKTPAGALSKLASDDDRAVLRALAERGADANPLPEGALLTLARHSDPNIAGLARARPEYRAVAAKVRTRRLIAVAVVAGLAAAGWAAGVLPIEQWLAAMGS